MDNFIFRFSKIHSPYFLKNEIGECFPDTFLVKISVKQEDALLPLFINYALKYAIGKIQANQEGVKLNGKYELLINVDNVN
jgi:hypothetical protein